MRIAGLEGGNLVTPKGNFALNDELKRLGDKKLTHPYFWSAFTMIGNPWQSYLKLTLGKLQLDPPDGKIEEFDRVHNWHRTALFLEVFADLESTAGVG